MSYDNKHQQQQLAMHAVNACLRISVCMIHDVALGRHRDDVTKWRWRESYVAETATYSRHPTNHRSDRRTRPFSGQDRAIFANIVGLDHSRRSLFIISQ